MEKQDHPNKNTAHDPFSDLSKLRINPNFNETIGVKKALLHVPVRKPNKQEFFRVHPNEEMRLAVAMIDMKEEREVFLVTPELAQDLPGEVAPKLLVTAINKQGVLFLWPLNLDLEESRIRRNQWNESAHTGAELAKKGWVKISANMSLGAYDVLQATGNLPDPEWPELSFQEILKIAFKDNFITSADHVVIQKLRGQV